MQQLRCEFAKLLREGESNVKEKLSKMYVDDNICIVERLKKGWRFVPLQSRFISKLGQQQFPSLLYPYFDYHFQLPLIAYKRNSKDLPIRSKVSKLDKKDQK